LNRELNKTRQKNKIIWGGKNLLLLQIASTKLYCYHSVIINVIGINRNQSLIVLQKYCSM
jgi:hypothetical protein